MQDFKFLQKGFLVWRLLLFIPVVIAYYLLPYRSGFEFTSIWDNISPYFPVSSPLLFSWANFDGVHYLAVAVYGYTTEANFFPLYPLLIRIFATVFDGLRPFGLSFFISGFLIANISFFAGLYLLYKLIRLDFSVFVSKQTIIFLLLFPTSFFFGSLYSEGLFFMLLVASFYFARQGRWFLASILGALLSATRLPGVLIFPALFYELVVCNKNSKNWVRNIFSLFLIPLGLFSYMVFNNFKWGNPFYFIQAQGQMGNNRTVDALIFLPQTIYRYLKILLSVSVSQYEWSVALLELAMFVFISLMLIVAFKKGIRKSYLIFAVLAFLLPVSSGTFSGLPRYVIVLFPVFLGLALIKKRVFKLIYALFSTVFLFILVMLFSRGYFVA